MIILSIAGIFLILCIILNLINLSSDLKFKVNYFLYHSWFHKLSNACTHKYLIQAFLVLEILAHTVLVKLGYDIPRHEMGMTGIPSLIWAIIQKIKFLGWLLVRNREQGFFANVWGIISEEPE